MNMKKRGFSGTLNPSESQRERNHRAIARRAAAEGIVLLKNGQCSPTQVRYFCRSIRWWSTLYHKGLNRIRFCQ